MASTVSDMTKEALDRALAEARGIVQSIENEIRQHMIGQKELVRDLLLALFAGGNVLLEGLPGLGKTRLVKTLGKILELNFSRIQFTPDLMPADITGTNILTGKAEGQIFSFVKGPLFGNIILADEVNRATPKTQSALLEAMQEATVTISGVTHPLPQPFFVIATQNPIEQEGTYPLPEAQLDRFLFKLWVPSPGLSELIQIATLQPEEEESYQQVASREAVLKIRHLLDAILIAAPVLSFAAKLIEGTHPSPQGPRVSQRFVRYGASPRGMLALVKTAKARALFEGRYHVSFEDIKAVALPALRHRIFLNFDGISQGLTTDTLLTELIQELEKSL